MIYNHNFVIVSLQPWDTTIGSNCKNIALEISKNNNVLYVNCPLQRNILLQDKSEAVSYRKKVIAGELPGLVQHSDTFWVLTPDKVIESINKIKWTFLYDILNHRNNKIFASTILSAVNKLGFNDFYLFNDNHIFLGYYLPELLHPKLSIYYMRDFLTLNKYWKQHGCRLEPKLMAKYNLVVTNSLHYESYAKAYNPDSYMVGQGCDLDLFNTESKFPIPNDIPSGKPIIGYMGYLSSGRLDILLLDYLAESKPEWNFVLIGPEDERFSQSTLHNKENVFFLGFKPESELPLYINSFDVAINPQQVNVFTTGNYPRKVDEYLAMGKPTVVTSTKAMEYFGDHVYACQTKEDYVVQIEKALSENTPQKQEERKKLASSHSWENNVNEIYRHIELVENK